MVFKATFKFDNISIILWQSVLLVEYPEKTDGFLTTCAISAYHH
jgi:hypothetical protein